MSLDDLNVLAVSTDFRCLGADVAGHDVENLADAQRSTLNQVLVNDQDNQKYDDHTKAVGYPRHGRLSL